MHVFGVAVVDGSRDGRHVVEVSGESSGYGVVGKALHCVVGDVPAPDVVGEGQGVRVEAYALPVQLCGFAAGRTAVQVFSWLVPEGEDAVQVEMVRCCAVEFYD